MIKNHLCWLLLVISQALMAEGLSPYSSRELDQLEKEFVQQINQSEIIERNPLAKQYIDHLGKKLAHYSQIKSPDFFTVKSTEINAFAGPGGHIGINSQLILTTSNESELAGVMAHEIAHVRLHHLYGMIEHQKQMRIPMLASLLASLALGAINPTAGMGSMMGSMSGFSQEQINFSRSKEKEADRIGIDMLIKAGFNPQSMAAFFKKMQENSRYYYTAHVPAILRSHPLDSDRIAEAENRSAKFASQKYPNSAEYALFKELIRNSLIQEPKSLFDYYAYQCRKISPKNVCQYGRALALLKINEFAKAHQLLTLLLMEKNNRLCSKLAAVRQGQRETRHRTRVGTPEHSRTVSAKQCFTEFGTKSNLYIQIAMAEAEIGLALHKKAISRLAKMQNNNPNNYAVLMAYAQGLATANQNEEATQVLLKGSRQYKKDLLLCQELARAQARSGRKAYAYFTQAQCLILQGQTREAVAQLKVARSLAPKDSYLLARITDKIDEIAN